MSNGTEGIGGPIILSFADDETGTPSIFWTNPWSGKQEIVCKFFWPTHPPEDTEAVEAAWQTIREHFVSAWNHHQGATP